MASVSIDPFALPIDVNGKPSALPAVRPGISQNATYTGTHGVITNPISIGTRIVRVVCTTAAYVKFGTAPTATSADYYVAAGEINWLIVPVPGTSKLSAVQVASGGTLIVNEVS